MAWYGWLVTVMTWLAMALMAVVLHRSRKAWDALFAEVVELRERVAENDAEDKADDPEDYWGDRYQEE